MSSEISGAVVRGRSSRRQARSLALPASSHFSSLRPWLRLGYQYRGQAISLRSSTAIDAGSNSLCHTASSVNHVLSARAALTKVVGRTGGERFSTLGNLGEDPAFKCWVFLQSPNQDPGTPIVPWSRKAFLVVVSRRPGVPSSPSLLPPRDHPSRGPLIFDPGPTGHEP